MALPEAAVLLRSAGSSALFVRHCSRASKGDNRRAAEIAHGAASLSRRPWSRAGSTGPQEAWIAADLSTGGVRVLITGPQGFERVVTFALDDDPAVIAERVRETAEG